MSDGQEPKRRGRPPKADADRKDGNLTFRTRAGLREKLAEAAAASNRSISEEVERRLEKSFDEDLSALRQSMFGEPKTEDMLRKIVWAARLIEDWYSKEKQNNAMLWADSEVMRAAMRKAIQKIVLDATPYAPTRGLMQAVLNGATSDVNPIDEAEAYGLALGTVLTGNPERLAVNNLGMGPQTEW